MTGKVYFIGAGPGDPELITCKGRRIISESDVIIYAGSLVNPAILAACKSDVERLDSAGMDLQAVLSAMTAAAAQGRQVARVHSGDPSLYGAIREQMDALAAAGIPYEVIPGVSSFTAAAAALGREFTLPGVSQTVICTRMAGRTPVPEAESLDNLASHRASMAIFLSVGMIGGVVQKLLAHYPPQTSVAVVERATWPDERIVTGCLCDIADKVRQAGITRTAQILVGDFLGDEYELSRLYDRSFSHGYRKAVTE